MGPHSNPTGGRLPAALPTGRPLHLAPTHKRHPSLDCNYLLARFACLPFTQGTAPPAVLSSHSLLHAVIAPHSTLSSAHSDLCTGCGGLLHTAASHSFAPGAPSVTRAFKTGGAGAGLGQPAGGSGYKSKGIGRRIKLGGKEGVCASCGYMGAPKREKRQRCPGLAGFGVAGWRAGNGQKGGMLAHTLNRKK